MTITSHEIQVVVLITLVDKATGASPIDIYTSTRVELTPSGSVNAWPILRSVDGIGSKAGQYLPEAINGRIVLDNTPNSIGFERRFIDLLERYTPVGQDVSVYIYNISDGIGSENWTSKCIGWSADFNEINPTVTLNIASEVIPKRVVTKVIDSTNFSSAPSKSLGKHLPIVFTSGQVKPVQITADGASAPRYAYATTLGSKFISGGVSGYIIKDHLGNFGTVTSAAATSTAVYSQTGTVITTGPGDYYFIMGALGNKITISGDYVITHVKLRMLGTGNGAFVGASNMRVSIWHDDKLDVPTKEITHGEAAKSDYQTSFRGATSTSFDITFALKEPVVINAETDIDYEYYIAFSQGNDGASGDLVNPAAISGAGQTEYHFDGDYTAPGKWAKITGQSNVHMYWEVFGLVYTDDPSPSGSDINIDGLGHGYFEITQQSAPTNQTNPDISNLDIICTVTGLKDDGSGTITGTPNALITGPVNYIQTLDFKWNGSTWVSNIFNASAYSATHYLVDTPNANGPKRDLAIVTEGRQTLDDIYSEICYQSACRLAMTSNPTTPLGLYAWGSTLASEFTIDDEDAAIVGVQQLGTENVINRINIYYDKRILAPVVDFNAGNAEGQYKNYAKTLNWYSTLNSRTTALMSASVAAYGAKELARPTLDWVSNVTYAENMAEYFSAYFAQPPVYVVVDIPFQKYSTLDILDCFTLSHPSLPAYFGTSANAKNPDYNNDEVDINNSNYWKRAQSYRAQVEGIQLNFRSGAFPVMRITARLLLNFPNDPT